MRISPDMPPRPDLGPKPHLGYTESRIDRAAERRTDANGIAALARDRAAAAYVVGGEMILARKGAPNEPLFTLAEAQALAAPTETIFLGLDNGAPRFGIGIAPAAAEELKARDDLLVTDLRSIAVQGLVAAEHLPPIWKRRRSCTGTRGIATAPIAAR